MLNKIFHNIRQTSKKRNTIFKLLIQIAKFIYFIYKIYRQFFDDE